MAVDELRIRDATNDDGPAVTVLVFAVLVEYGLTPDPAVTDADLADVEAHYQRRGGVFEVVEAGDGRVVGCVGLYPLDEQVCELRKMYLDRRVRGRGLGRTLLERMIGRARAAGFRKVRLETASVLVEAIRLYQRYGFAPDPHAHLSPRCDQAYVLEL